MIATKEELTQMSIKEEWLDDINKVLQKENITDKTEKTRKLLLWKV